MFLPAEGVVHLIERHVHATPGSNGSNTTHGSQNGTATGGSSDSYTAAHATSIVVILAAFLATIGLGMLIGWRLRWLRAQPARNGRQTVQDRIRVKRPKPPPPSLDALNKVAPVQRCAEWFKKEAVSVVTLSYDVDKKEMTESSLDCSICLKNFEESEDIRQLPCQHPFHQSCFDDYYLRGSTSCPLCRVALFEEVKPEESKAEGQSEILTTASSRPSATNIGV